jgi:hypothetical protein
MAHHLTLLLLAVVLPTALVWHCQWRRRRRQPQQLQPPPRRPTSVEAGAPPEVQGSGASSSSSGSSSGRQAQPQPRPQGVKGPAGGKPPAGPAGRRPRRLQQLVQGCCRAAGRCAAAVAGGLGWLRALPAQQALAAGIAAAGRSAEVVAAVVAAVARTVPAMPRRAPAPQLLQAAPQPPQGAPQQRRPTSPPLTPSQQPHAQLPRPPPSAPAAAGQLACSHVVASLQLRALEAGAEAGAQHLLYQSQVRTVMMAFKVRAASPDPAAAAAAGQLPPEEEAASAEALEEVVRAAVEAAAAAAVQQLGLQVSSGTHPPGHTATQTAPAAHAACLPRLPCAVQPGPCTSTGRVPRCALRSHAHMFEAALICHNVDGPPVPCCAAPPCRWCAPPSAHSQAACTWCCPS